MLRILGEKKRRAFWSDMLGESVPVLLESDTDAGLRFGFTGNYVRVAVPASETEANTIVEARLDAVHDGFCTAAVVRQEDQR